MENAMNTVITEKLRADDQHGIHITDVSLIPGEEVEVIVRPAQKQPKGFLQTALSMNLDLPADYSVAYEQQLRKH
jgi:hypothetical protein